MNKDEALNKFTFMMEYRNLSSNTIHMYQWYLSQMFDFYQLEDVSILDVSMAQNYVVHMKQTYAPASLNAVISAIRYFFDVVLESPLSRRQFPNILYHPVEITVLQMNRFICCSIQKIYDFVLFYFLAWMPDLELVKWLV